MRDAMGGTVVLVIIVAFIVIVLAYLAFNVNYTKAFRMKDKIISVYDDYNGKCHISGVSPDDKSCEKEINYYARQIGYNIRDLKCPEGFTEDGKNGYCYKETILKSDAPDAFSSTEEVYYTIVTKINLDVPIINNILNLEFFYISGETKIYKRHK